MQATYSQQRLYTLYSVLTTHYSILTTLFSVLYRTWIRYALHIRTTRLLPILSIFLRQHNYLISRTHITH